MNTLSSEQRRFLEQAAAQYTGDLTDDPSTQQYLAGRGFGQQAAQRFRLGAVRRPLAGHEEYRGRLAIPYLTPAGVVNMRFRCLRAHDCKAVGCPKYLSSDGMGSNLYNVLDLKRDSPFVCVTEGELDAATLSMCGLPAVGAPGIDAWQDHWSRCLADFDVIYSLADPDKAGRKFAKFLAREVKARPIRLPRDMDVNELYCREGPDGLRGLIPG